MPYVLPERRPALDKLVDALIKFEATWDDMVRFFSFLGSPMDFQYIDDWVSGRYPLVMKLLDIGRKLEIKPNGDINYVLFKYCKYHVTPSYNNYKNFMGCIYNMMKSSASDDYKNEFREAAEWIRIKLLIPYEEKKILDNGDV